MMSWKTAATVIIIVFVLLLLQATLAGPMTRTLDSLNETGDYSNEHFDGNSLIPGYISSFFDMILVGVFGMMGWAAARILRREITRGGRR